MRDPLDELENFSTPGLTMDQLPAAEVRRRGTRMRRRNHALAAIGGVAAVAIIATPLALAATGDRTDTTPPPAPQPTPSVTWVTEIPAGFPLAEGMPTPVEIDAGYQPRVTDICGPTPWNPDNADSTRQAVYADESEGGLSRTLALYPSDVEAEQAMTVLADRTADCAASTAGRTSGWSEVLASEGGAVVYANHYTDGGDTDVVRVVRVGNAVLQDTTYTMGGGDPAVVQQSGDRLKEKSAPVVDAMCVFAADPC